MIFRQELAEAVRRGEKTVTRRVPSANPRSPWYARRCGLRAGATYAVQPGRGVPSVALVRVTSVRMERLGRLDDAEARREGFPERVAFEEIWRTLHGWYDERLLVWRVEFELA